jgi:hypothetical protein
MNEPALRQPPACYHSASAASRGSPTAISGPLSPRCRPFIVMLSPFTWGLATVPPDGAQALTARSAINEETRG